MAKIASSIVCDNGLQDVVKVIPKRSTELVVGVGKTLCFLIVSSDSLSTVLPLVYQLRHA